jgi:hypothetical protein
MDIDRNTIQGFAQRIEKNLNFFITEKENSADVHIVTELTTSLLGLIVFPYEHFKESNIIDFSKFELGNLEQNGWPSWKFLIGDSNNLADLLWHLRNALSHRRIRFSSDDRNLQNVDVTFSDRSSNTTADNWSAQINAADLLTFALNLSKLIDQHT